MGRTNIKYAIWDLKKKEKQRSIIFTGKQWEPCICDDQVSINISYFRNPRTKLTQITYTVDISDFTIIKILYLHLTCQYL
jgi:hypothetical protein